MLESFDRQPALLAGRRERGHDAVAMVKGYEADSEKAAEKEVGQKT